MTRDNIVYLDIPVDYPRYARQIPNSVRANAVPAPRLAVLRHRSRTSRLRASRAIAFAVYRFRRFCIAFFGMPLGQLTVCCIAAAFIGFALAVQL